ncbi:MAG TPA: phosphotransferase [Rhizomicrobium sp.]|nr:phosphotransferase [Rhizomicrobium sp.]
MTSDDETPAAWTARIRDALPGLAFTTLDVETYGDDNHVLVFDRAWIVRTPRAVDDRWRFRAELKLLAALWPVSPLRVPHYEFVAADGSMGAYRMIPGVELTPPIFALLSEAAQQRALIDLARFLTVLHHLPEETIRQPDGMIQRRWSGEQHAARYRGMRRARIARVTPADMLSRFDTFHEALAVERAYIAGLAHDDLTEDHILVNASGAIVGVIDFTDAAWGDPASDFAWLWRLGEARVDTVLAHYGRAVLDPELKTRSLWNYVRFLINQIAYGDKAKWTLPPDLALAELDGHLKRLGI